MRASDFDKTFLLEITKDNEYIVSLGNIQIDYKSEYITLSTLLESFIHDYHSISLNSIDVIKYYIKNEFDGYAKKINDFLNNSQLNWPDNELKELLEIERQRLEHITKLMKDAGLLQEETLDY